MQRGVDGANADQRVCNQEAKAGQSRQQETGDDESLGLLRPDRVIRVRWQLAGGGLPAIAA